MSPRRRPDWLGWKLVFSDHVQERMLRRHVGEDEVQRMIMQARRYRRDRERRTYLFSGKLQGRMWEVALDPDRERRQVVVVTAYIRSARG